MPPLKGAKEIEKKLQALARNLPKEVLQAVTIEAELVKTDSQKNYVPVDLGILRSEMKVFSEMKDNEISARIAVGGESSPYALAVHEHLSKYSPKSWKKVAITGKLPVPESKLTKKKLRRPGTVVEGVEFHPKGRGPKYLERPLMAAKDGMGKRIAGRVEKKIDKIVKGG